MTTPTVSLRTERGFRGERVPVPAESCLDRAAPFADPKRWSAYADQIDLQLEVSPGEWIVWTWRAS